MARATANYQESVAVVWCFFPRASISAVWPLLSFAFTPAPAFTSAMIASGSKSVPSRTNSRGGVVQRGCAIHVSSLHIRALTDGGLHALYKLKEVRRLRVR